VGSILITRNEQNSKCFLKYREKIQNPTYHHC
jgi:hypothetical protein